MVSHTTLKTSAIFPADAADDVLLLRPQSSLRSSLRPDAGHENSVAPSLAGTGNKPAAQDPMVSTVEGSGPAKSAGFEGARMVSRTSLKTSAVFRADAPNDVLRSQSQGSFRSGLQSTANRDASAVREAVQPSFPPDAPHAVLRSDGIERPHSSKVTLHEYGTMTATNYVSRTLAGRAYEHRDEQPLAMLGRTNLQRDASALTLASGASAKHNPVLMHHASRSARGPQGVAASTHGDLLFRSALNTPPVPATPSPFLSSGPNAAQPISPTAPNLKNVDVAQLANRIYELLVRRLSSERQQRGM